ncbi:aspartate dehydrogenase [Starkeya sp. ORNL1]|uniref:aspartate dehydrogenase n=1 Tax=Starkeya sp. ORNL1 TaxID=2709380 RepID=UPI0014641D7D|nr:aspartate dehydrogenase [Starkeya sp. ORNL1]QJP15795.1 aspartate dehydrogenase [Starkeya sp. ORNL1]
MAIEDTEYHRGLRLCLIGSGAISRRVAELIAANPDHPVELVAIGVQPGTPAQLWWPARVQRLEDPGELAAIRPDVVVEVASRDAVSQWGEAALRCAPRFVVCSASAFTDDALLAALLETARACNSQLVIAPGALGGLQALSGASLLAMESVTHTIAKPPAAWNGTAAAAVVDLATLAEATTLFEGSARQVAAAYPMNANAAVLSSLAGIGLDGTRVRLVADPSLRRNRHEIGARGAFGELRLSIENEAMPSNPKTSDMTALSLVRLLESYVGPLVV